MLGAVSPIAATALHAALTANIAWSFLPVPPLSASPSPFTPMQPASNEDKVRSTATTDKTDTSVSQHRKACQAVARLKKAVSVLFKVSTTAANRAVDARIPMLLRSVYETPPWVDILLMLLASDALLAAHMCHPIGRGKPRVFDL